LSLDINNIQRRAIPFECASPQCQNILALIMRQAHHSAMFSHQWLSVVEAISLGALIYCCSPMLLKKFAIPARCGGKFAIAKFWTM